MQKRLLIRWRVLGLVGGASPPLPMTPEIACSKKDAWHKVSDITVIGWIDGAQIALPSGADHPVELLFPTGTGPAPVSIEQIMNSLWPRVAFVTELSIARSLLFPTYVTPLAPDGARRYANAWLIKDTTNNAPPAEFLKLWPGLEDRRMINETALSQFRDRKRCLA